MGGGNGGWETCDDENVRAEFIHRGTSTRGVASACGGESGEEPRREAVMGDTKGKFIKGGGIDKESGGAKGTF